MRKAARFGVVLGENAPQACRSAIQASDAEPKYAHRQ